MNFDLSRWLIGLAVFFVVGILAGCDIGRLILTVDPWDPPLEPAIAREPLPRDPCAQVVEGRLGVWHLALFKKALFESVTRHA